ncbi:MAG TPA: LuxR C-terminal-related transcriptional regulator [Candidatus Bathyarchaeia archaeon]|nr:LuxR C-terminal-related transcriptional regulator [Candidatus Bathyarchaeia archaeon]
MHELAHGPHAFTSSLELDCGDVGFGVFTEEGHCVVANQCFAAMFGVPPNTLSEVSIFRMFRDGTSILGGAFFHVSEAHEPVRNLGLKTGPLQLSKGQECLVDFFIFGKASNSRHWIGATVSDLATFTNVRIDCILAAERSTSQMENPPPGVERRSVQRAVDLSYESMNLRRRACELILTVRFRHGLDDEALLPSPTAPNQRGSARLESLSPREQALLRLLATGNSNKKIASELSLSARTVEHYRARMMAKLHLRSFADVVLFAVRSGLIQP